MNMMELQHLSLRSFILLFFVFQVLENRGRMLVLAIDEDVRVVYYKLPSEANRTVLKAGRAMFGTNLKGRSPIEAKAKKVEPAQGCTDIENSEALQGKIGLVDRGACMFIEKARYIQRTGATAAIVLDNNPGLSSERSMVFVMHHGYQDDDITIPMVFLYSVEAQKLFNAYSQDPDITLGIADVAPETVSRAAEEPVQTSEYELIPTVTVDPVPTTWTEPVSIYMEDTTRETLPPIPEPTASEGKASMQKN